MSLTVAKRNHAASEMNVTPLIDVLLVLLIIFMVMPHHLGERADIPMPAKIDVEVQKPDPALVIWVHHRAEGGAPELEVNKQRVSWSDLDDNLRLMLERRLDRTAFIKGDPEVDFQYVAEALDIAHHAGADRIGLLSWRE